jgi:hypothetical protein
MRARPLAVRRGLGPVHIGIERAGRYVSACGRTLTGPNVKTWKRQPSLIWGEWRRCDDCDEIADHAPNLRTLYIIAGWS